VDYDIYFSRLTIHFLLHSLDETSASSKDLMRVEIEGNCVRFGATQKGNSEEYKGTAN